jgi:hypothetical protein
MPAYFSRALREVRSACFPLSLEMCGYLFEQPIKKARRLLIVGTAF